MPTPSWLVPVGERIRASATPANADGTLSFSNGWQVADSAQQKGVSDTLKQLHPGGGACLHPGYLWPTGFSVSLCSVREMQNVKKKKSIYRLRIW